MSEKLEKVDSILRSAEKRGFGGGWRCWDISDMFLIGRRSLRKDSAVSSFLVVGVTGHQDRPYQGLLGEKKKVHMFKGISKHINKLRALVCFYAQ